MDDGQADSHQNLADAELKPRMFIDLIWAGKRTTNLYNAEICALLDVAVKGLNNIQVI